MSLVDKITALTERIAAEFRNINVITRNFGELVLSSLPQTDAGLHLVDGSRLPAGGVYDGFVQKIKSLFVSQNPSLKWLPKEQIVLPTFSANTQDGITISDARGNTTNLQAIFNGTSAMVQIGLWTTYWINIDYAQSTLLTSYTIQADNSGSPEYPSAWVVNGSDDGETWETIDSQSGITFALNESKTFTVNAATTYKQYRIVFSDGVLSSSNGELKKISFDAYSAMYGYEKGLFFTEEQWQACVAKYGSCGKFVYSDDGVRLPKVSDIVQGTTDASALGDLIEAGLPNITGTFTASDYGFAYSGAFYQSAGGNGIPDKSGGGATVGFDASRVNGIYGNSDKVQPQSIKALLYIVVANATKTAVEVNIDNVVTELNEIRSDIQNVATRPYIVEMGANASGWWKIWSNGWVEQGNNSISTNKTIPLNIEMATDDYSLLVGATHLTGSASTVSAYIQAGEKTTTSFFIRARYGTTSYDDLSDWKVEGWKA